MTSGKETLEEFMPRQRMLFSTSLEALWKRFPEANRRKLIALYAQLIAQAARAALRPCKKEESTHDDTDPCG